MSESCTEELDYDDLPWKDPGFRRGRDVILACGQVLAREAGHTREPEGGPLLLSRLLAPESRWPWHKELFERLQPSFELAVPQGPPGLLRLCRLILEDWQRFEAAQHGLLTHCGTVGPALLALLGAGYLMEGMGNGFDRPARLFGLLDPAPSTWLEMMQDLVHLTDRREQALLFAQAPEGLPGPCYEMRFGLTPKGMALLGIPPTDTLADERRMAESRSLEADGGGRDSSPRFKPRTASPPPSPQKPAEQEATLPDLLSMETPELALTDLVLSEEADLELEFLVHLLRSEREAAPVMLFHGPPGTGKTHAARCLAGALERPLGVASLDRLQTKWHGDTEKAFRKAFDEAAGAGAILLLDEVDALLCSRGTMALSWQISQVNTLLKLLEAPPVPVILCTNFLHALDAAVHRRIQHLVEFPIPDRRQRMSLWNLELDRNGIDVTLDLDLSPLASLPLTGGLIRNAALQFARRIAVYGEGFPATTQALLALARKELPKIEGELRAKAIGFAVPADHHDDPPPEDDPAERPRRAALTLFDREAGPRESRESGPV